jgi:hypothetical protein
MIVRRTRATMSLICCCQRHDDIHFNIDLVASKVSKQVLSRGTLREPFVQFECDWYTYLDRHNLLDTSSAHSGYDVVLPPREPCLKSYGIAERKHLEVSRGEWQALSWLGRGSADEHTRDSDFDVMKPTDEKQYV